jgi:acetyl-CoA carboxylase biotin carboxyl carrier protein
MAIDFKELRELLGAIAKTDITELTLKNDDFELTVRKNTPVILQPEGAIAITTATSASIPATPAIAASNAATQPEAAAPAAPSVDKKWVEIKSPMVGTFYRSPAPDEAPFVSVGDRIPVGQTVCIIEAMKLMNEIEAELAGQVMEILVENGQPVEFGQTLMYVNPG